MASGNPGGGGTEASPADGAQDTPEGGASGSTASDGQPFVATTPDHDATESRPVSRGSRRPARSPRSLTRMAPAPPRPRPRADELGARVEQAVRFIVHNWPLKLAAIALATLLYAGLVASQDSTIFPGPVAVTAINKPDGTVVTNDLRDLDQIRYIAPLEVGRLRADDFEATVDLSNVKPDGQPVSVRVAVTPVDARVTVLDFQPRSIQVVLDEVTTKQVPVDVQREAAPEGVDVGEVEYEPTEVTVTGPSAAVSRVVSARVVASLDPEGIDFDREVEARPVDDADEVVVGVELDPRTVHVSIPLFTNRESRTLPVNPVVTGTTSSLSSTGRASTSHEKSILGG